MKNPYSRRDVFWIGVGLVLTILGAIAGWRSSGDAWGAWFFVACTGILLLSPVLRSRPLGKKERVEFDGNSIRRYAITGKIESIAWNELHEIDIVTTDEGPYVDDVSWLFVNHDESKGCAVSNGAEGFKALLEKIQLLPNFDNEAVIKAMGSTSNNRFVIWKRVETPNHYKAFSRQDKRVQR